MCVCGQSWTRVWAVLCTLLGLWMLWPFIMLNHLSAKGSRDNNNQNQPTGPDLLWSMAPSSQLSSESIPLVYRRYTIPLDGPYLVSAWRASTTKRRRNNNSTCLLLPGFPDHAVSWHATLTFLAQEAGCDAWAVTLRGYEPSSLDTYPVSLSQLVSDVQTCLDFMQLQGASERVHIIGHDWGAVIAQATAAMLPDRVHSVVSLAIPSLRRLTETALTWDHAPVQLRNSWYFLFFQLPFLPEQWLASGGVHYLWQSWSSAWAAITGWSDIQATHVVNTSLPPWSHTSRAALSYYRNLLPDMVVRWLASRLTTTSQPHPLDWAYGHPQAVPLRVPALFVVGAEDACMDAGVVVASVHRDDFVHGVATRVLPHAGHWVHLEQPDQFHRLLAEWISPTGVPAGPGLLASMLPNSEHVSSPLTYIRYSIDIPRDSHRTASHTVSAWRVTTQAPHAAVRVGTCVLLPGFPDQAESWFTSFVTVRTLLSRDVVVRLQ
jgi:pimeloyl-ACP methyl ester carboxylesterase